MKSPSDYYVFGWLGEGANKKPIGIYVEAHSAGDAITAAKAKAARRHPGVAYQPATIEWLSPDPVEYDFKDGDPVAIRKMAHQEEYLTQLSHAIIMLSI
jgi:hypothetical protein